MPLTDLVLDCLISGASFSENGKRVSVDVKDGERFLFFHSDSDDFRNHLNLKNQKSCGLLVIYSTKGISPLLFFIELKGKDVASVVEQLSSTLTAVKAHFKNHARLRKAKHEAFVVCSGVPPSQHKKSQKDFQNKHNAPLKLVSGRLLNLREKLPSQ